MISLNAFFLLELKIVLSSLSIYYVLPFIAHCFSTTDTCGISITTGIYFPTSDEKLV